MKNKYKGMKIDDGDHQKNIRNDYPRFFLVFVSIMLSLAIISNHFSPKNLKAQDMIPNRVYVELIEEGMIIEKWNLVKQANEFNNNTFAILEENQFQQFIPERPIISKRK